MLLLLTGWGGPWDFLRPAGITSTTRDVPLTPAMLTYPGSILDEEAYIPWPLVRRLRAAEKQEGWEPSLDEMGADPVTRVEALPGERWTTSAAGEL